MATPFNAAAAAYSNAARLISGNARPQHETSAAAGAPDFAKMLTDSIQQVEAQGDKSDKMAFDMVNGVASPVDMVTAISETEMAVQTMVTVRDRVISAYEEIMRMPI
ncbi:flagellar hook-basal body complex protein FliE 1 [Devosia pacifica]|uniref:Flagellar hook-basal body complex protein FliE n=1 Tax=Devosia pacifica TaxID=1335967 RepID=A0A918RZB2_9HYPH|nr:flagellar hook-basal body complex protein FliE [Devosia pacifica]GHA14562.1 flagellar hook-basal body complex protein FliE 1 [Devosia pacifica]